MDNINETENENSYQSNYSNKDEDFKNEENKSILNVIKKNKKGLNIF